MRKTGRSVRFWAWLICAALLSVAPMVAPQATAGELGDAKVAGQVAEGPDGFIHVVDHGSADVEALVKEINAKRKAKYKEIAKKEGAPLDAVASQAGKKLLTRVPAGQFVMDSKGTFHKK